MDLNEQLQEILDKKYPADSVMEETMERLKVVLPMALPVIINQIAQEISNEIMFRKLEEAGRVRACRFWRTCPEAGVLDKCIPCEKYQPKKWWQFKN